MFESTWSISMFGCFFVFFEPIPISYRSIYPVSASSKVASREKLQLSFAMEVITGGELTGAFYVGFLDGLLGAGIIVDSSPVDQQPENSLLRLRLAPVSDQWRNPYCVQVINPCQSPHFFMVQNHQPCSAAWVAYPMAFAKSSTGK